jgi:hypothetical protein
LPDIGNRQKGPGEFLLFDALVEEVFNDTSNRVGGFMRVLLVLFLICLALLEYFYQFSAHMQSGSPADIASHEKSEGVRLPPRQDHQGH